MPLHLNMSPLLLRVLKILFMKLLGTTSLLVATCFSVSIVLLIATIDTEIFRDGGFSSRTYIDLDSGHGISRTLPTSLDGSTHTRRKFQHKPRFDTKIDQAVTVEWDVHNYTDVFLPGPDCSTKPYLLIIVTSAPENTKRRTAIRNTWARYRSGHSLDSTHFKTVFLLGKSSILTERLQLESEKHKDILFGDYIDSYRNLTLKVQSGIVWAAESCQSKYLLKTDDDCFVNTKVLVEFLQKYNRHTEQLYAGHKLRSQEVVRLTHSKWYVSQSDYPREQYPPYASGTGYLLSSDVVQEIAQRNSYHHPFPVEDAYMGVLAEDMGVDLLDSPRFALFSTKWSLCNYLYFFVIHDLTPEQQYLCLRYSDESDKKCQHPAELQEWE